MRIPLTTTPIEQKEAAAVPTSAAYPGAHYARVLVVHDNQDVRESTTELLAMAGFVVRSAASGFEALDLAVAFMPTAILLDVGLPDLSGYDVARRLRELPQFANTLLIALTGYDTPEAHALSAAAGFDHQIAKPVNFDELARLLT